MIMCYPLSDSEVEAIAMRYAGDVAGGVRAALALAELRPELRKLPGPPPAPPLTPGFNGLQCIGLGALRDPLAALSTPLPPDEAATQELASPPSLAGGIVTGGPERQFAGPHVPATEEDGA